MRYELRYWGESWQVVRIDVSDNNREYVVAEQPTLERAISDAYKEVGPLFFDLKKVFADW